MNYYQRKERMEKNKRLDKVEHWFKYRWDEYRNRQSRDREKDQRE